MLYKELMDIMTDEAKKKFLEARRTGRPIQMTDGSGKTILSVDFGDSTGIAVCTMVRVREDGKMEVEFSEVLKDG